MAVELRTGEIPVEISVDDLRLRIWDIWPWNWGYIVHRPARERELSTDIFPVRER